MATNATLFSPAELHLARTRPIASRVRSALAFAAMFLLILVTAGAVDAADVRTSTFAAPWAIIAHGPFLEKPVVMADWYENHAVMLAVSEAGPRSEPATLARRPYVALALFWGPEWKHLQNAPAAVARLEPQQANQHARFFPAQGDSPAILALNMSATPGPAAQLDIRSVDAKGLAVLTAHGIPVRLARE